MRFYLFHNVPDDDVKLQVPTPILELFHSFIFDTFARTLNCFEQKIYKRISAQIAWMY